MKIKLRRLSHKGYKVDMPVIRDNGDWIDLMTAERVSMLSGEYLQIPLGIAVEMPNGFEAVVVPRSSTFRKWGVFLANSQGVIDNTYSGSFDEWCFPAFAAHSSEIPSGTRICQFRIQPSQFATPWQKIKWLFTRKIEIVEVDVLNGNQRGGLGSTGD